MADPTFHRLAESPNFLLVHSYESVFVVDRRDGSTQDAGDHYGDPTTGLVTSDEQWFVSVGEGVQCLSAEGKLLTFFRRGHPPLGLELAASAWHVSAVELVATHRLRVTIDLNSMESSDWAIDLDTGAVTQLRSRRRPCL